MRTTIERFDKNNGIAFTHLDSKKCHCESKVRLVVQTDHASSGYVIVAVLPTATPKNFEDKCKKFVIVYLWQCFSEITL